MEVNIGHEIIVVGAGMAGLSCANRAAELGRNVAVLEKAPEKHRGGHTQFSESFRVPSTDADLSSFGYEFAVPDYSPEEFYNDIMDRTNGKADKELARTLVEDAGPTVEWLTERGVEWDMEPLAPGYTAARTWFDGEEAVATLVETAESDGATVYYRTEARELIRDEDGRIGGVRAMTDDGVVEFRGNAVVVGGGGYESSTEKRARYYGSGYDDMKVRGSRYNTGGPIEMMMDAGAVEAGQWSGAHMAIIDANAPDVEGGANRVDGYQYGLILNTDGERFVDEGEDARAHTYAKFGRRIFEQPDHRAFIIVDSSRHDFVRATGPSDPETGDSVEEVLRKLGCQRPKRGAETVAEFNAACDPDQRTFDPNSLDGNSTTGIEPPKSNWAFPVDEAPYYGYAVTGGITFAFGGVATNSKAEVLDSVGQPIPGLYAAGNSVGGLFYDNYPGGTSLTNAAVYGKIAAEQSNAYLDSIVEGSQVQ